MNYYLLVLQKKYALFTGRSQSAEYWYYTLFNIIMSILLIFMDIMIWKNNEMLGLGLFNWLYTFAVLIPWIAVSMSSLHDVGKSGRMLFMSLIPLIGRIWLLVLMVSDSQPGENKYWPNPKGIMQPSDWVY